jgi:hypothetical protein
MNAQWKLAKRPVSRKVLAILEGGRDALRKERGKDAEQEEARRRYLRLFEQACKQGRRVRDCLQFMYDLSTAGDNLKAKIADMIAEQPPTELETMDATYCGCGQCDKPLFVFRFRTVKAEGPPMGDEELACKELTKAAQQYLACGRAKLGLRPIQPVLTLSDFTQHERNCRDSFHWVVAFDVDYSKDLGKMSQSRLAAENALFDAAHAFAQALTPEGRDS